MTARQKIGETNYSTVCVTAKTKDNHTITPETQRDTDSAAVYFINILKTQLYISCLW